MSECKFLSIIAAVTFTVITHAQDVQAQHYNKTRKLQVFNIGDQVLLSSTNPKTQRPSKKLDARKLGPFPITAKIRTEAYRFELPASFKIHNVFHVSLPKSSHQDTIPGRIVEAPPPVGEINHETGEDEREREVDQVLKSRLYRGKLQYFVRWKGLGHHKDS